MVSLLSSKIGVQKALPQSPHPVSCPAKGSCTGGSPTEWVFRFFYASGMFCRMKGFTVVGVQILPPNLPIRSNPNTGGRPQTQSGTRWNYDSVSSHDGTILLYVGVTCTLRFPSLWCTYLVRRAEPASCLITAIQGLHFTHMSDCID